MIPRNSGTAFLKRFGPWALITGASSGIGAEFARQLAAQNFNLVLVARRKSRLEDLARTLERGANIETRVIAVDLAQAEFLHALVAETEGRPVDQ
ncbi:MAG TPA: SDR family NAD(P)-dependent oxidoreductase [Terriglobales bacterium]|nr:SDR family NAD(P)-dependent oxidoreductase [Terriglobales bacterium]